MAYDTRFTRRQRRGVKSVGERVVKFLPTNKRRPVFSGVPLNYDHLWLHQENISWPSISQEGPYRQLHGRAAVVSQPVGEAQLLGLFDS